VIVASGTQAALAAAGATKTIPIVMALSHYPVELGLVASLARPGGNVTGLNTYSPQLTAKKLELLREIAPKVARIALLWNPANPAEQIQYRDTLAAARAAGVAMQSIELERPDGLGEAFDAIRSNGADALMAIANPITFRNRRQLADFALANRLPGMFEERLFVAEGGLISYSPNFTAQFRAAATYVDRILKGARPADLPVEQPVKFELVINMRTARALGLAIPPSLLLRADKVIE
jgi:putative ABC transport system substrate-binding protein